MKISKSRIRRLKYNFTKQNEMDIEYVLRIIFYVLVILVLLIFVIYFIYSLFCSSSSNYPKDNCPDGKCSRKSKSKNDDVIEVFDLFSELPSSPVLEMPAYQAYAKEDLQLVLKTGEQKFEDTINYEMFCKIRHHSGFLKRYHAALSESYEEKERYYLRLKAEAETELLTHDRGGMVQKHDTTADRLEKVIKEITLILKYIQRRKQDLSLDQIRKNLDELISHPSKGLDSLIGREDVKDFLCVQIYAFVKDPNIFRNSFQNILIYGNSGVGKTKLAETMGYVYAKSGILVRGKTKVITKRDLTSPFVNESPQLSVNELNSTLEGILFIDEAYALVPPPDMFAKQDNGKEAIDEIVKYLDKYIGRSVVIAAGYENEMETRFMTANEGLERRFPNKIILSDYSSEQLTTILVRAMRKSAPKILLQQTEVDFLYTSVDKIYSLQPDIFSKQAGDMINLAGIITRTIAVSVQRSWKTGTSVEDCTNNKYLLLSGINEFLRSRNCNLQIY